MAVAIENKAEEQWRKNVEVRENRSLNKQLLMKFMLGIVKFPDR